MKSNRRLVVIGLFTFALVLLTACQATGRNPDDLEIPFVTPTPDASLCLNNVYPQDAPGFDDISADQLVEQPSGIRVFDRQTGTGTRPTIEDLVTIRYTAWLADGCVFDSTYTRGQDANLLVFNLIPGWQEALLAMAPGTITRVEIPPDLAYQDVGSPPIIPANATLTFDIELVSVLTQPQAIETATAVAALFTPTPEGGPLSASCRNDLYPDDAPQFDEVTGDQLVVQDSGISVYDITVGDGDSPGLDDVVWIHYVGWLTNGCVFDDSYLLGEAARFPVGGVIPGFRDAILGMSVGGQRRVEIPPDLGYGSIGAGSSIPPDSTIIFDIVLESIEN